MNKKYEETTEMSEKELKALYHELDDVSVHSEEDIFEIFEEEIASQQKELQDITSQLERNIDKLEALESSSELMREELALAKERLEAAHNETPPPQKSFFSTTSKPQIANAEQIKKILKIENEIRDIEQLIDSNRQAIETLMEENIRLASDTQKIEADIIKNENRLEQARNPTTIGRIKEWLDNKNIQNELSSIEIPTEEDAQTDVDELSSQSSGEKTEDLFDDTNSSSDITDVPEYSEPEPRSRTSSNVTVDEERLISSVEEKRKESAKRTKEIEKDKENFLNSVIREKELSEQIKGYTQIKKGIEEALNLLTNEIILNIKLNDLKLSTEKIKSVDDCMKNYQEQSKLVRINSETLDLDTLDSIALSELYPILLQKIESDSAILKATENEYKSVKPTTTLGNILHNINKFFRGLFGGKTRLEKLEELTTSRRSALIEKLQSANVIQAKARIFRAELINEQKEIEKNIGILNEELKPHTKNLETLMKQYKIPENDNLVSLQEGAIKIFDKKIKESKSLVQSNNEQTQSKSLIARCDGLFSTLFSSTASTQVRKDLKEFLEKPTQTTLATLEKTMNDNPDYIKNKTLVKLLKDAKMLYKQIPRINFAQINEVKLNANYAPKIQTIEEKIFELRTEKTDIENEVQRESPQLLEISKGITHNLNCLRDCQRLLLLAENYEKSLSSKDQESLLGVQYVIKYLKEKREEILAQLPPEAKTDVDVILNTNNAVKLTNYNYEIAREEIRQILFDYQISLPHDTPINLQVMEQLYARLPPETQQEIHIKIHQIPEIFAQVDTYIEKTNEEDVTIVGNIKFINQEYNALMTMIDEIAPKLGVDLDSEENLFAKFIIQFEAEKPYKAFNNLIEELSSFQESHPEEVEALLEQIEALRERFMDKSIDRPKPISDQFETLKENTERGQKDLSSIEHLEQKISALELKKQQLIQERDACIIDQIPPPETIPEIQEIISQCKKTKNWFSSDPVKPVKQALAEFLEMPTIKNLEKLHERMRATPQWTEDSQMKQLINASNEYFPQIKEQYALDLSAKHVEQQTPSPIEKTRGSRESLKDIKKETGALPEGQVSAVDAEHNHQRSHGS